MKYYFIMEDKKMIDTPEIMNWYQKLNVEDIKMGTYHKIPNRLVLQIKSNSNIFFPEVLFYPCFMIGKKIKDILKLYEPTMRYKEVILLDVQNEKSSVYYIPYLEEIDCLDKEKTQFGNFKGTIEKGTICRKEIGDTCVFYLKHNNNKYYVARQDFLESMLRRDTILKIVDLDIV